MTATPIASGRVWAWFTAWWLIGGLWTVALLGIATIGLLILPAAVVATIIAARRSHGSGVLGLVSGLGVPLFYVAYLNRDGPGNVCTSTAGRHTCVQEWSPWPWLAVAVALTLASLLLFQYRHDHDRPSPKYWHPS